MTTGRVPTRMCAICRVRKPKRELTRYVAAIGTAAAPVRESEAQAAEAEEAAVQEAAVHEAASRAALPSEAAPDRAAGQIGGFVPDPAQILPGRGLYLCGDPKCAAALAKRGGRQGRKSGRQGRKSERQERKSGGQERKGGGTDLSSRQGPQA